MSNIKYFERGGRKGKGNERKGNKETRYKRVRKAKRKIKTAK